jgi:hypothetical protein
MFSNHLFIFLYFFFIFLFLKDVMDEVGSAVHHDDVNPTVVILPFYYIPKGIAYGIMWPLRDIKKGERWTRNFYTKRE